MRLKHILGGIGLPGQYLVKWPPRQVHFQTPNPDFWGIPQPAASRQLPLS